MRILIKTILLSFLFCGFFVATAQEYCLQFSKKGKKTVLIKKGRNISFVFSRTSKWKKGKLVKITKDSLFIEQYIGKQDILTERGSNYSIRGYELVDFRVMAYNNAPKIIGKSTAIVLFVAAFAVSNSMILPDKDVDDLKAPKKFFKKNVDLEDGWLATTILSE